MKIQPKYIQLIGDAVIPLLGFFLWNWSLYFILLFYIIDLLLIEVVMHLKTKKTLQERTTEDKSIWYKQGILSTVLFVVNCILIHLAVQELHPTIDFQQEALAFWSYKDMGIEQGYILLPLLIIVAYQKYKMEFLMPGLFRTINLQAIWKEHKKANIIQLAFIGLAFGVFSFISPPEWLVILLIVALSSGYKLLPPTKT
ncbi:MAG: hypothetical protein NWS40_01835 [Crocinitomicaceae bacterium]|nr:hypothetical protein [Crocinitomicaceae bacterium]MDP4866964.1 hypothetical protein [Crocinitomicaceae bacterium]